MTLQRFLFLAFFVFLLGIGVLYAGINRVPFRMGGGHEMHKSSLSVVIADYAIATEQVISRRG